MNPALVPMTLGDLFDRLFKLIGSTWVRNLALACIILLPIGLVFAVAADIGFTDLADAILERSESMDEGDAWVILGFFAWFFAGVLLFILGTVVATVGVTVIGCSTMAGEETTWQDALRVAFGPRMFKVLGMYIVEIFLFGGIIGIPYALIISAIVAESGLLGFIGGLLFLMGIVAGIYLAISFAFTVPVIAWEDDDVFRSFRRSWSLVRRQWWRTFGILILMGLMVSFAVSLVMTPLYIVAFWEFFRTYFQMLSALGNGVEPDPSMGADMIRSLGLGFGLITVVSSILQLLVAPLYTVVMYFDLRARKGEFPAPAEPARM